MALIGHLSNMVNMMNRSIGDYSSLERLSRESQMFGKRRRAVQWMKEVACGFRISSDARDSGIQIFDKFLALILEERDEERMMKRSRRNESAQVGVGIQIPNCRLTSLSETPSDPDSQLDPNIVSYAAAVSIILGSKLHESNGELTLASFQDFEIESLKHFERFVLKKLLFCISPQVTPFAFIRKFLQIWDPENENSELTRIADSLVADFWEETTSMLFAPSTIAIAALILSFSVLRQDCTDWLSSIPNFCLPLSENPLSHNLEDNGDMTPKSHRVFHLFDIDRCLKSFKPVEAKYSKRTFKGVQTISPTSIAGLSALEATPKRSSNTWDNNNGPESGADMGDHCKKTFGEIDFESTFPPIVSDQDNTEYSLKEEQGIMKFTSSKKRSLSLSNLSLEEVIPKAAVCQAGDLFTNHFNSTIPETRDSGNIQFDRTSTVEKLKDFHQRPHCEGPIAKKQRVVTREMSQRNDNGGVQAVGGNKYATVNIVFDHAPSNRGSIDSKRASDDTDTHTSPLLSLQSDLHLESVDVPLKSQLREIPATLPIR